MSADVVGSLRVIGALDEPAANGRAVGRRVVRSAAREASERLAALALDAARALAGPRTEDPLGTFKCLLTGY